MKIYQTLKPSGLALMASLGVGSMLFIAAIFGDFSVITPQLVILVTELAAMFYGVIFGDIHLTYCTPASHGYKFFRSMPDFESQFRKQCVFADIIVYSIGFIATVVNFIFMQDTALSALIGVGYLFIIALSRLICAFVSTDSRLYIYPKMISAVPMICGGVTFALADNITNNELIPINNQYIIFACVTVFAIIAEVIFYKRLEGNLKASYGKG